MASSDYFGSHCWNIEKEEISLALQFGLLESSKWQYGKIISGPVSDQLTSFLLRQYRTMTGGKLHQKIFRQMNQKAQGILGGFPSIFEKYDGKF